MIATLLLCAVIGAIVYGSRHARRATIVSVPVSDREETWRFDVRDMRAEVVRTKSSKRIGTFALRRTEAGRWELAADDAEDGAERGRWTPCEEHTQELVEAAYRRYNGM